MLRPSGCLAWIMNGSPYNIGPAWPKATLKTAGRMELALSRSLLMLARLAKKGLLMLMIGQYVLLRNRFTVQTLISNS